MKIVNYRTAEGKAAVTDPKHIACCRGNPLGNPYIMHGEHERNMVIEQFRKWLWDRIRCETPHVMAALRAIKEDSILGCWCIPKRCHCEVIIAAWEWLKKEGKL